MSELRREWVCGGCKMRVFAQGKSIPAPAGWRESDDTCLRCRRDGDTPEDLVRTALLEGSSVNDAWRIARQEIGRNAVIKMRKQLVSDGRLPSEEPESKMDSKPAKRARSRRPNGEPNDGVREKIEAELRADPDRPNKEISSALGTSYRRVSRVRVAMGLPKIGKSKNGPKRGSGEQSKKALKALRAEPEKPSKQIAEETGVSTAMVRKVRREAGIPNPKLDRRGRPVGT